MIPGLGRTGFGRDEIYPDPWYIPSNWIKPSFSYGFPMVFPFKMVIFPWQPSHGFPPCDALVQQATFSGLVVRHSIDLMALDVPWFRDFL